MIHKRLLMCCFYGAMRYVQTAIGTEFKGGEAMPLALDLGADSRLGSQIAPQHIRGLCHIKKSQIQIPHLLIDLSLCSIFLHIYGTLVRVGAVATYSHLGGASPHNLWGDGGGARG